MTAFTRDELAQIFHNPPFTCVCGHPSHLHSPRGFCTFLRCPCSHLERTALVETQPPPETISRTVYPSWMPNVPIETIPLTEESLQAAYDRARSEARDVHTSDPPISGEGFGFQVPVLERERLWTNGDFLELLKLLKPLLSTDLIWARCEGCTTIDRVFEVDFKIGCTMPCEECKSFVDYEAIIRVSRVIPPDEPQMRHFFRKIWREAILGGAKSHVNCDPRIALWLKGQEMEWGEKFLEDTPISEPPPEMPREGSRQIYS